MSLFNQTVARVAELERALAASEERCRNLEIALKAARTDKYRSTNWRSETPPNVSASAHDLNTLSDDDVEAMFAERDALIARQLEIENKSLLRRICLLVRSYMGSKFPVRISDNGSVSARPSDILKTPEAKRQLAAVSRLRTALKRTDPP